VKSNEGCKIAGRYKSNGTRQKQLEKRRCTNGKGISSFAAWCDGST